MPLVALFFCLLVSPVFSASPTNAYLTTASIEAARLNIYALLVYPILAIAYKDITNALPPVITGDS